MLPERTSALTTERALRVHVERVKRMACCHEQPIALDAAEAQVGAALRQSDEADRLAGGIENPHPVLLRVAHAPTAPEVAIDVATQAVRGAARLGSDACAAVRRL